MAKTTGTATDYSDFLDKLITFVTAHGWNLAEDSRGLGVAGYVILEGTGIGGTDSILVGIAKNVLSGIDVHGLIFNGYVAYINGDGFLLQPGAATARLPGLPLQDDTIPYWFYCTASEIRIVAKVQTVYMHAYLGYLEINGTPGQYPYPLVIGGCNITDNFFNLPRFSDTSGQMVACYAGMSGAGVDSTMMIRDPAGVWKRILDNAITVLGVGDPTTFTFAYSGMWPFVENLTEFTSGGIGLFNLVKSQNGDYPLLPIRVLRSDTPDIYGIFTNVRALMNMPGLSSEDTITDENADTWIVFQDTFRTNLFYALKDE